MRKINLLLLVLVFMLPAQAEEPKNDFEKMDEYFQTRGLYDVNGLPMEQHQIKFNYMMPGSDLYDSGHEYEYQYRRWNNEITGWAISVGTGEFSFATAASSTQNGATTHSVKVDAKVDTLPIGVIGLIRMGESVDNLFIFSYGLRYTMAEASGGVDRYTTTGGATKHHRDEIQVKDVWSWDLGMDYQRKIVSNTYLSFGAGFRRDLGRRYITAGPQSILGAYTSWYWNTGIIVSFK